ncbi:MAG: autotransporter-associated beta strand repeat-containing protein [Planctomycetaceae bacterium]
MAASRRNRVTSRRSSRTHGRGQAGRCLRSLTGLEALEPRRLLATFSIPADITRIDSTVYGGSEPIVKQGPGRLVLSAANLHTGGTVVEEGTLVVRDLGALGSGGVQVRAGAMLVLDGGIGTFVISSLALDPGGRIDVGASRLHTEAGLTHPDLLSAINTAKGDGTWNGTSGIGSSVVQKMGTEGTSRTLGWLGWAINEDSSFVVGFAAAGDTNLDGLVDVVDMNTILSQMSGDADVPVTWNAGDFNHDATIDVMDLAELFGVGLLDAGSYLPAPPPASPRNLQALPFSTTSITLSWATDDAPAGYEIERSADGITDWQPVAPGTIQITGTSAMISGFEPGERASFRVRAFAESPSWWWDDRYRSADTAAVAATAIPSAPGSVSARGVTPTQAEVNWTPGPGRSTGAVVERRAAGDTAWVTAGTAAAGRSFFHDAGVEPGQTYSYCVQSVSDAAASAPTMSAGPVTMPTSEPSSDADHDGDGVPDVVELVIGSNTDATDTDGDGVGDAAEMDRGSDPADRSDGGEPPVSGSEVKRWGSLSEVADIPALPGWPRTDIQVLPAGVKLPAKLLVTYSASSDDALYFNGQLLPTGQVRVVVDVSRRWFEVSAISTDTSIASHDYNYVSCDLLITDIDVDSNNNNHLEPPERSSEEEQIEKSSPKKVIFNSADNDDDKIPDYADWWIAGKSFTPVVVQIPEAIAVEEMTVTFDYAASDPDEVSVVPPYALPENGGPIRLWAKNASDVRSPRSVPQHLLPSGVHGPGDFVKPGVEYDASALGFSQSARTIVFYVEGVRLSKDPNKKVEVNPIKIEVKANGMVLGENTATVSVMSNFLVIGIDGTDQSKWLKGPNAKRPNGLWNSRVRSLLDDVDPYAMTIYDIGPVQGWLGDSSTDVFRSVRDEARSMITAAGGDTKIAIVGWSRGAMIGLGVADALLTLADGDLPRTVVFVGMYDPVDMSLGIDNDWARVHRDVKAVTIVGPSADRQTEDAFNVDFDVMDGGLDNPHFVRMARGDRIRTANGATTAVQRLFYNASHGALGGTPGYNKRHRDGGEFPENYDYGLDLQNSILADKDVRAGMRAAGLTFVPDRDPAWYGFPAERPPKEHRA